MSDEQSGPVTFGQLSVVRSLDVYGSAGQAVANLVNGWEVPRDASLAHITDAWQQLVAAHDSLRTALDWQRDMPTQHVHAFQPRAIQEVEVPDPTWASTQKIATAWAADPFPVDRGEPWRAFVATHRGIPRYLIAIVHHTAADNGALRILQRQFKQVLTGASLDPQPQPMELARTQQADPYKDDPLDHWTEVWGTLLPEDRTRNDVSWRRRATLYSRDALLAAQELSDTLRVSLQSVVLGIGALALARLKGRDSLTFGLMAANRLDEHWAGLVSSLNQCAPLTLRIDENAPARDFLRDSYHGCLMAYLHGCFDVDALAARLNQAGHDESDPTHFALHYNFLGEADAEPPMHAPMRRGVQWRSSTQRRGPNFHLAVSAGEGLFIGVGASHDFLPGDLPAVLATSIEAGIVRVAEAPAKPLREVKLDALRVIQPFHGQDAEG